MISPHTRFRVNGLFAEKATWSFNKIARYFLAEILRRLKGVAYREFVGYKGRNSIGIT